MGLLLSAGKLAAGVNGGKTCNRWKAQEKLQPLVRAGKGTNVIQCGFWLAPDWFEKSHISSDWSEHFFTSLLNISTPIDCQLLLISLEYL